MGDSITAGTGALAENVKQIVTEFVGVSFSVGKWKNKNNIEFLLIRPFNPLIHFLKLYALLKDWAYWIIHLYQCISLKRSYFLVMHANQASSITLIPFL